ncbi:DUF2270 domain-containing protein [Kamptonema cortianum]|nr:DUF2270 domain-containing protein [Oscillatoria laete-virens]MDK3159910.1 DUF2270 domain-containing protein [Kamptonema cortianum]MDL5050522.1 DUF2270 domain-containing protein [Oscillatoria amoena NRMC-F 0135]MDL5055534.1 DUF2270 domain-containing protein [Oscillatoria laete-virens NRMC-F 0139]
MDTQPHAEHVSPRDYYTSMSHLYRGELGRIMMWRQRLDATTNWAILAATGVITFALGSPSVSHIVFMLANMMVFLLMVIEGRRYRYYDAYRARVRILEAHFYVPVILQDQSHLQGAWRKLLAEDMLIPSFKMSLAAAVGKRLNQNYCWIFLVILASLFLKIFLHFPEAKGVPDFFAALHASQPLVPAVYWLIFVIFYGALVWLSLEGKKSKGLHDEFSRPSPKPELWKI